MKFTLSSRQRFRETAVKRILIPVCGALVAESSEPFDLATLSAFRSERTVIVRHGGRWMTEDNRIRAISGLPLFRLRRDRSMVEGVLKSQGVTGIAA